MKVKTSIFIRFLIYSLLISATICIADPNCSMLSEEVTLYFGIETNIPDINHPVTVDVYHTDVEVSFTSAGWDVVLSYDEPGFPGGNDVNLNESLLYGNENSYIASVPAGFEFTGANEGDEMWILPQSSGNGALPLGFAAERSDSFNLCNWEPNDPNKGADIIDKWYKVKLLDVKGPEDSDFSLWQTGPTTVFMSTAWGGITDGDVYYIIDGGHAHMNWGFTKQGLYEIDFRISTVYKCDSELTADLWPLGDEYYRGDCIIDFYDYAVFARNWFEDNCDTDPGLCEGADMDQPVDNQVDLKDLDVLAEQWFTCGYPKCDLQ